MFEPTADLVATALFAAARETGSNPLDIVGADRPEGHDDRLAVSRARAYAGMALRARCKGTATGTARMIGVAPGKTAEVYFLGLIQRKAQGKCRWWDERAFQNVLAAIDWFVDRIEEVAIPPAEPEEDGEQDIPVFLPARKEPAPPARAAPGRPFVTAGKRDAMDELRRAVENTARMTPPPE